MSAPKGTAPTEKQREQMKARFQRLLQDGGMACVADSYYEFSEAMIRGEAKLYQEAALHGREGVEILIDAMRREIHKKYVSPALKELREEFDHATQRLKQQIQDLRQRFFKPVDYYREELERHDWFFAYSDSLNIYNAGEAVRKRLLAKAINGGQEFKDVFVEVATNHKHGDIDWDLVESNLEIQHIAREMRKADEVVIEKV